MCMANSEPLARSPSNEVSIYSFIFTLRFNDIEKYRKAFMTMLASYVVWNQLNVNETANMDANISGKNVC